MDEPSYGEYELKELLEIREHLDRDRFADRYARLCAEIEKRERQQSARSSGSPEAPGSRAPDAPRSNVPASEHRPNRPDAAELKSRRSCLPFVIGFVLLLVVGGAIFYLKYGSEMRQTNADLQPVLTALYESTVPLAVRVELTVVGIPRDTREMVITVTDPQWTRHDTAMLRARALELGRIAMNAHPQPDSITDVKVVFETPATGQLVERTEAGFFDFSAAELRSARDEVK